MSLPKAEIPGSGRSGLESLPPVTKLNRGLYALVFWFLGIALILLIVSWVGLALGGKPVPDGIPVIIATIVGAMVGVVSTNKAAV
jgi:hypothetical protein